MSAPDGRVQPFTDERAASISRPARMCHNSNIDATSSRAAVWSAVVISKNSKTNPRALSCRARPGPASGKYHGGFETDGNRRSPLALHGAPSRLPVCLIRSFRAQRRTARPLPSSRSLRGHGAQVHTEFVSSDCIAELPMLNTFKRAAARP